MVNVRRRTTRWTVAYFEVLVNASLVNVFTIINNSYRQKVAIRKQMNIENLPQTVHLNRRYTLYKLGKSFCKKIQDKKLEKQEFKVVSFEEQLNIIRRTTLKTKRNRCFVHSFVYNIRSESKKYCSQCGMACCEMHFAANNICYLCNRFSVEQKKELDKERMKYEGEKHKKII